MSDKKNHPLTASHTVTATSSIRTITTNQQIIDNATEIRITNDNTKGKD